MGVLGTEYSKKVLWLFRVTSPTPTSLVLISAVHGQYGELLGARPVVGGVSATCHRGRTLASQVSDHVRGHGIIGRHFRETTGLSARASGLSS